MWTITSGARPDCETVISTISALRGKERSDVIVSIVLTQEAPFGRGTLADTTIGVAEMFRF